MYVLLKSTYIIWCRFGRDTRKTRLVLVTGGSNYFKAPDLRKKIVQTTSLRVQEKKLGKSLDKEEKGCTRKAGRKNKWDSKVAAAYARESSHIKIDWWRGRELVEKVLIRMTDKQKAIQYTVGDMPIDFSKSQDLLAHFLVRVPVRTCVRAPVYETHDLPWKEAK